MYDDFNNPANDGSYNKSQWARSTSSGNVEQQNSVLMLSQDKAGGVTELNARSYSNLALQSPMFFEAKLRLDPDQDAGNVLMGPCCGNLDTNCMLSPLDNTQQVASCWINRNGSPLATFPQTGRKISLGSWHTFRIEFDPVYRGFTFFMDNERIGAYTATAAQVAGDLPTFMLRVHKSEASSAALKGYFDDVRIGPLEK